MSWQGYVDNLMATKQMTAVGIFGLDGSTWAASAGFPLATDHIKQIIASVNDSSKMINGLSVAPNEKYILVRNDPGVSILLKREKNGIVANKSSQSIIVAIHNENFKSEQVLTSIGRVVDYLQKHGY